MRNMAFDTSALSKIGMMNPKMVLRTFASLFLGLGIVLGSVFPDGAEARHRGRGHSIVGGAIAGGIVGGILGGRRGARAGALIGGFAGAVRKSRRHRYRRRDWKRDKWRRGWRDDRWRY